METPKEARRRVRKTRRPGTAAVLACLAFGMLPATAATPPPYLNYQGVLRSAGNTPLSGAHDMIFRFYDAATGPGEILIDAHTAAGMNPIVVAGGMFSAQLGGGAVSDGMGPGVYLSLAEVFRDHAGVWLEIQVGSERLAPRVLVESAAYALNASHLEGQPASSFLDTSAVAQFKGANLTVVDTSPNGTGVVGSGLDAGGAFFDQDGTGIAYLGFGDNGLQGHGSNSGGTFIGGSLGVQGYGGVGGRFESTLGLSFADVAFAATGIIARGSDAAGQFTETGPPFGTDPRGTALLGSNGYGVDATGEWPASAGRFGSSSHSGEADLGYGDGGILARGSFAGGEFTETDSTAHAWLAHSGLGIRVSGTVGVFSEGATWGVYGSADDIAGYFVNPGGGNAYLAMDTFGLQGVGVSGGSFLNDANDGKSSLAHQARGIWGKGDFAGGTFSDMLPDYLNLYWADVATSTRKIAGTGTVSFVQNHPLEKDRSIVYAAPEGDEVAVYTRGTAKLAGGEARVTLGETFKWVANPDVGLTAQVTPRGEAVALAVTSLTTGELVVKGPDGSGDVVFDYIVWGLRIGFEGLPVVQQKRREAYLPDSSAIEAEAGSDLSLASTSAGERFRLMDEAAGRPAPAPPRAPGLVDEINEGRERFLSQGARLAADERRRELAVRSRRPPAAIAEAPSEALPVERVEPARPAAKPVSAEGPAHAYVKSDVHHHPLLEVTGRAMPGDVLAMDPDRPGSVRAAARAQDVTVTGCVPAPEDGTVTPPGHVRVAVSGVVLCRADATDGPIAVGDLLTTSATPAHAMKAGEAAAGAILGKAMEPLEAGTGLIRVLIALR